MSTPTDHFNYKNGSLSVEGLSLAKIAAKVGTPAYIYSTEGFLGPLKKLQKGLAKMDPIICFAVKANSNIAILKLLSKAGAGMDLVSGGELFRVGSAGTPGSRIVFSGVGKTPAEMEQALDYQDEGIFSFNVESVQELATLSKVAEKKGRIATVALRFNPDVDAKTHPYISTGLKKNKFGLHRKEILAVAKDIHSYPGIRMGGVSAHIGSQLLSLSPLNDSFAKVRALIEELDEILPAPLNYVDLGGGIGITYKNEKSPSLEKYCALVEKYFGPDSGLQRPLRVVIEPGRILSGNSGVLLSEVLYRKESPSKDFLIIDAAMNDLIRPALYQSYHEIIPVKQTRSKSKKSDVVGPVCESADCFASDRPIPTGVEPGDLLAILSAGAYGFAMACNYNGRPRPPEVLVHNGKFRVIRDRETYEDLIRGERT